MAMAKSLMELRNTPEEELIRLHDEHAEHTLTGVNYYLDEIHRRDAEKVSNDMRRYTLWMTRMTVVIMIATIVNVVLFAVQG